MNLIDVKIHKLQNGKFQTCYFDNKTGSKKRKSFPTKAQAKEYQRYLLSQADKVTGNSLSNLTIGQLMQMHLEKYPKSAVTERKNSFVSFMDNFSDYKISEFTTSDARTWFESINKCHDYSERTLNRIKSCLNAFFRHMIEEEIVRESPLTRIKFNNNPAMKKARIVLSIDEVKSLLDDMKEYSPEYLYPIIYTVANIGARKSEILTLKKENVDFNTRLIHLVHTKNGENRSIRMSDSLAKVLKDQIARSPDDCPWVFFNEEFNQIGDSSFKRALVRFDRFFPREKHWGCHALRHSFAYNFLKEGGQMYQLQAILGHKSIGVTVDLYGQLKAQDIVDPSPYKF